MTLEPGVSLSIPAGYEVVLDGVRYPARQGIHRYLISQYPGKIIIGDSTRDSRPNTSLVAYTNWSGGLGIERLQGGGNQDRVWWSTMDLSYEGHLVLAPRADSLPEPLGVDHLMGWAELGGRIYGVFRATVTGRDDVFHYDGASWGSSLHTLRARFNSIAHVEIEGDDHLVIAHADGLAYSSNGTTWTDTGPVI